MIVNRRRFVHFIVPGSRTRPILVQERTRPIIIDTELDLSCPARRTKKINPSPEVFCYVLKVISWFRASQLPLLDLKFGFEKSGSKDQNEYITITPSVFKDFLLSVGINFLVPRVTIIVIGFGV